MRWWVEGADTRTGEAKSGYITAANELEARAKAEGGGLRVVRCIPEAERRAAGVRDGAAAAAANRAAMAARDEPDRIDRATEAAGRGVARVLDAAGGVFAPEARAERERAKRQRLSRLAAERERRVALGHHVQWVRLTSSSEIVMVLVVASGVFLGLMAFSCCGFGSMVMGLGGAIAKGFADAQTQAPQE